tara:strand:- start:30353 stop:30637 length:285 start_codon:yes stop_codon:yes gene_type:complete
MISSFRYSEQAADFAVNLYLFQAMDGSARANVKGPVSRHTTDDRQLFESMTSLTLHKAFSFAIRMANRNDVEIVVSGDRSLWDANWGNLAPLTR